MVSTAKRRVNKKRGTKKRVSKNRPRARPKRFRPSALAREVAASVDATPALLPHLAELFEDLTALGSTPRRINELVTSFGIGYGSRVLDLACGKGAVSIELSSRLGCICVGVDAFRPFVLAARAAASRKRISHRCTFRVGDVRKVKAPKDDPYDCAMMIGFMGLAKARVILRRHVRIGGLYLIDDAIAVDKNSPRGVMTADEARMALEAGGDIIVHEEAMERGAVRRLNDGLIRRIQRRAQALSRKKPALREELRAFLERQQHANEVLIGPIRPTIWVVRRGG